MASIPKQRKGAYCNRGGGRDCFTPHEESSILEGVGQLNISTALRRAGVALTVLLLSACAGTLKPTDKTAVVKAGQWGKVYRGGYVELAAISGGDARWRLRSEMEVNPGILNGVYYIYLCTQGNKHCTSVAEAQISFKAEAGHAYYVRAREQVNGSNRFWVWIEDEADGRIVGGTPPGSTS